MSRTKKNGSKDWCEKELRTLVRKDVEGESTRDHKKIGCSGMWMRLVRGMKQQCEHIDESVSGSSILMPVA